MFILLSYHVTELHLNKFNSSFLKKYGPVALLFLSVIQKRMIILVKPTSMNTSVIKCFIFYQIYLNVYPIFKETNSLLHKNSTNLFYLFVIRTFRFLTSSGYASIAISYLVVSYTPIYSPQNLPCCPYNRTKLELKAKVSST